MEFGLKPAFTFQGPIISIRTTSAHAQRLVFLGQAKGFNGVLHVISSDNEK